MNSKLICVVSLVAAMLGACVKHDYVGERHAPTQAVQVFYNEKDVPEGYRTMGQDRATSGTAVNSATIVDDIIKQAQANGADAVLIEGLSRGEGVTQTTTSGQVWQNGQWVSNSTTSSQQRPVVTARFLKKK